MARPPQPIDLIVYKGRKNVTKEEVKERKKREVKAPSDKVKAPSYLPTHLKKEFTKISKQLIEVGIMSNLDIDALARYLLSREMYIRISDQLLQTDLTITKVKEKKDDQGNVIEEITEIEVNKTYSKLLINQDRLFKQCRVAAADLGLTISSRCKLVVPPKEEKIEKTEEEKLFGDAL
ncbi:phage terminase small subunit P27 family [Thermoactinomyces sp. DSM 45892]|uniref:phage terminase small subunit P27 family n=1 Tax=Thermoactinomyces sp. DSM 45892 TaxID=1882753 RepID=UPI00089B44FF|nr:phage terminase small subunit P27 family [Thermoactinomyces sp. DSM 45892]SDY86218.1 phage terminase, small subunit, putative, P27 family [Thermoactinomyces sp. DSM 45892]